MTRRLLPVLMLLALPIALEAQNPPAPTPAATSTGTLRVFVDNCPCSSDYLRTEITFVDHVRDRTDADVHLLFGYQPTGAGGGAHTLFVIGLRAFAGTGDTLSFITGPAETADAVRQTAVRYIKLALTRYLARTAVADRIRITVAPLTAAQTGGQTPTADPWNFWVFRTSMSGGGNGEKSRTRVSTSGSLSATRTTEMWKTRISGSGRYEQTKLTVPGREQPDGTKLPDVIIRNYSHLVNASGFVVRSLGPHFASGLTSSASRSTFNNYELSFRVAPAIEYSVFPYSESARRLLTVNYSLGMSAFDYRLKTLYYKTSERVPDHQLQVSYEVTQPWGSAFGSVSGQQYLHNIRFYSASAFGFARIRLVKGLDLNFNGSVSTIYNQIAVPLVGATERDVLLNRRQLVTPYRVSGSVGLSYTFGAILNNIVNPRFNNFGGGETFFFF